MKHLLAGLGALMAASTAYADSDPVTMDPAEIDRAAPPGLIELVVPSDGAEMVGHLYTANGPGPHPTVIMLHGFPGNEKNLDVAQALRRAGFNTLYFHYRGAWGSGGTYSLAHVLADASAAISYVRAEGEAGRGRIDPTRISLFGHSLGGYNALMTGAADQTVRCTVAVAPADMVRFVKNAKSEDVVASVSAEPVPGLDGYSFSDLIDETLANPQGFDLVSRMTGFKGRPLMIISGEKDTVVPLAIQHPAAEAAQKAGAQPFDHLIMDADHSFSWGRIALGRAVVTWMGQNCR